MSIETRLKDIITRTVHDISTTVRQHIAAEVNHFMGTNGAAKTPARAASAKAKPAKAARQKPAKKGGRRTSEQVAADDARLLAYINAHPGQRSEEIVKRVGLPKVNVASGLQRLRDARSVKMKGVKRAATYTAA